MANKRVQLKNGNDNIYPNLALNKKIYNVEHGLGTFNSAFSSKSGYSSTSITIPAHTCYIVVGLYVTSIADSNALHITNLYNSIYFNNNDSSTNYTFWFNYEYPETRSTSSGNVYLQILAIDLT